MIERFGGWFSLVVMVGFLFDWLAIYLSWKKVKPFSKALAMLLLILWTFSMAGLQVEMLVVLLMLGQAFGLAGDILLLIDERYFMWGVGTFLVGHFFYMSILVLKFYEVVTHSQFNAGYFWWSFLTFLGWCIVIVIFYLVVRRMRFFQQIGTALWIAIQVYALILSGMVAFSLLTVCIYPVFSRAQMLLPAGMFMFLVSDALLTYNRFIQRIKRGQLWVRITYHLAQFSLAWGFLAIISK